MNICSKNIFLLCFVFYIPDFQENIKLVIAQKLLETEPMLFDYLNSATFTFSSSHSSQCTSCL